MKKTLRNRIFVGATAFTMAASAVLGCGGVLGRGDKLSADEKKSPAFIADRTITVQAYVGDIGDTLPKAFNDTPTMKKITELTGIKLDVRYTPGDSDSKVLATQLASGTIPDVILSYLNNSTRKEFPLLLKAAKEGMFANLDPFMKKSKVFSKYYEKDYLPRDTYENIVFRKDLDGVYLLHLNIPAKDRSLEYIPEEEYKGGMYIQKKIVDALKIDPTKIRTKEEFYDLLVKIKKGGFKDDNGNEVCPLGPKYWGGSIDALDYVIPSLEWGVSDHYNLDEDGQVRHEAERDSIYDEIAYVRKLLADGLMNPEFFTMDSTRAKEVSENHNSAIIADVHNYEPIIYTNEDWVPLGPLNDIQGDNKKVTNGKGGRGCMAISSKAEKPEEIMAFFDWLSTPEGQTIAQYGAEGQTYDLVDGKPRLKEEVLKQLNEGNTEYLVQNVGSGFGGAGNYFFEFVLTDKDNMTNFGESRPGASGNKSFTRSVQIAKDYPVEKKKVEGLSATAYLSAPELADVKTQLELLNWKETLVQAFYAKSDDEVKNIVTSFREQLKAAGVERFEQYVKDMYEKDPKSVFFYH